MRESIGSTWILQLVIVFILLFVSFLTLSLSYSKTYKIKNDTLSIIEKYEGLTETSVKIINNYLEYNTYNAKGKCETDGWYGVDNFANYRLEKVNDENKRYYYCIRKKFSKQNNYYYYELKIFLKFNLPVVGDFATFTIEGTTADVLSQDTSITPYN